MQAHLARAEAQLDGYDGPEQFAMAARIERGRRQDVVAVDGLVVVERGCAADFPDEVVGGLTAEPGLQHVADAEAFVLTSEEVPCALQPSPELHKACLIILNLHIKVDFD